MSISFSNTTGNLFNRLGAIFYAYRDLDRIQATYIQQDYDGINAQFLSNESYVADLQNQLIAAQASAGQPKQYLSNVAASNTLIQTVQADNRQPSPSLDYALPELIRQMTAASATVNACTVGITATAAAANNGNGKCLVSVIDGQGRTLENVMGENIIVKCDQDSQPSTGSTAVGSEVFIARGQDPVQRSSHLWPKGSGGATTILAASAAVDAQAPQNLLTNGDFESFTTANTPDSWTIGRGTAGTTIFSTTTAYTGSTALAFTGNATERTQIYQSLRAAPTTPGSIKPLTRYAIGFWLRVSSVPAAGVLRLSLRSGVADGSSVIGSGYVSVTLSAATTSYVFYSAQFNTPAALPDNLYACIELTTALSNTVSVYIDDFVITEMVQHQNGPLIAVFPGATKWIKGDYWTVAVTNARDGVIQEVFNRMFNMDSRGLILPSDAYGAETISDSLVSQ